MMRATVWSEVAKSLLASLLVMGSRNCGGSGMPPTPAGSMELASCAWACVERLTTTSYSFANRFDSSAVRIDANGLAAAGRPNGGCFNPYIGIGPAEVTFNWNDDWPERNKAIPAV